MFILLLLSVLNVHALEVIRPEFNKTIELRIVRAEPDSFETFTLTNHNGREMVLICANNRVYDHNPKAMIEYRNYYNIPVGNFTLESNEVCKDMGRFIVAASAGLSESKPFIISLNTKSMKVDKVVYPKIDVFEDEGTFEDLLPKAPVYVKEKEKEKVEEKIKPLVKKE